jgi:hypothetical protein
LEVDLARFMALQIFGDAMAVEFHAVATEKRVDAIRSPLRVFDPPLRVIGVLSTILTTNWWHLGMRGELPEFLCPRGCAGMHDFVGLSYYWGIPSIGLDRLYHLFEAMSQRYARAPVWPAVLCEKLLRLKRQFPELPILVVENGCVVEADGVKREAYLRRHIREVQRAVAKGCRVVGYLCWSITSNREWGLPFDDGSDFGLFKIELNRDPALTRMSTQSAVVYGDIIENRFA